MSLDRFTGQDELYQIFQMYLNAHSLQNPEANPWDLYDNFIVFKSTDNAAVCFNSTTTMFGDKDQRVADGSIPKNITQHIIDCAAYYLAQNIPADQVPSELRICLGVCHENTHWTGVMASVPSFRDFYQLFAELPIDRYSDNENQDSRERIIKNRAKNAIFKKLGIVLDDTDKTKITPEDTRVRMILDYFKNARCKVHHVDSMNSDYYLERVDDSLSRFKNYFDAERVRITCGQQHGNTCGDHTVINLFSSSMLGVTPNINGTNAILTSTELRELTELVSTNDDFALEMAAVFLSVLSPQSVVKPIDVIANEFEKAIKSLVDGISEHTDIEWTVPLVHSIRLEAGPEETIQAFASGSGASKEDIAVVTEITKTLNDLFKGKNTKLTQNIFKDIPDDTKIVFGYTAEFIALDQSAIIEHQYLRAGKSESALRAQEEAFRVYEEIKKERDKINKEKIIATTKEEDLESNDKKAHDPGLEEALEKDPKEKNDSTAETERLNLRKEISTLEEISESDLLAKEEAFRRHEEAKNEIDKNNKEKNIASAKQKDLKPNDRKTPEPGQEKALEKDSHAKNAPKSSFLNLTIIVNKAADLRARGFADAATAAEKLKLDLEAAFIIYQFTPPTNNSYEKFKRDADKAIDASRNALEKHRGWKRLLANLTYAIIGVGVFYLAACGIHKAITGRFLFFDQTDSEEKLDDLKSQVDGLKPGVRVRVG